MSQQIKEIPFLRYIGIMLTYKCEVACKHCIVHAGPHRKEEMLIDDAKSWIDQIALYRNNYVKALAFTGGEPFYNIELLQEASTFAAEKGLQVTVVTNAAWAPSLLQAQEVLKSLPAIGILSFSTDPYHLEVIPLEYVKNAALAAESLNIKWSVTVSTHDENDPCHIETVKNILNFTPHDRIIIGPTFPVGRALEELDGLQFKTGSEPSVLACDRGGTPVIFPDGRVVACIGPVIDLAPGHPLELGNLRSEELEAIFDRAEQNVILHTIRVWGPRKLIAMLNESGFQANLQGKYIQDCPCDACYRLMKDVTLRDTLQSIGSDKDFAFKVACARAHYMQESEMLVALGFLQKFETLISKPQFA